MLTLSDKTYLPASKIYSELISHGYGISSAAPIIQATPYYFTVTPVVTNVQSEVLGYGSGIKFSTPASIGATAIAYRFIPNIYPLINLSSKLPNNFIGSTVFEYWFSFGSNYAVNDYILFRLCDFLYIRFLFINNSKIEIQSALYPGTTWTSFGTYTFRVFNIIMAHLAIIVNYELNFKKTIQVVLRNNKIILNNLYFSNNQTPVPFTDITSDSFSNLSTEQISIYTTQAVAKSMLVPSSIIYDTPYITV